MIMATQSKNTADTNSLPDGTGRRIGIVAAEWHNDIVEVLLKGATDSLRQCGVADSDVKVLRCPGSFEIPVIAAAMARSGEYDTVLTLGLIIRGETAHFEYVAGPLAYGLQNIAIETGIPCLFGVLTTEDLAQAIERSGGKHGNKGSEVALAALQTCAALAEISRS